MQEIFFNEVRDIINIQKTTSDHLKRIGIVTLRDLLFYLPNSYQFKLINPDAGQVYDGKIVQLDVIIQDININNRYKSVSKILVSSSIGLVLIVFFNKIPNFISTKLVVGSKHTITGKIQYVDGQLQINHPEFILRKELESPYEPIYSLTYGITNKQLYGYILGCLDLMLNLADLFVGKYNYVPNLMQDLANLHLYNFNGLTEDIPYLWENARLNIAKQELIINQLLLNKLRKTKHQNNQRKIIKATNLQNKILDTLSFTLTSGQKDVLKEIEHDQLSPLQMNRMLQGDVGAGKTLVALLSILNVVASGYQAVLLAPTDLLANQHFEFFKKCLLAEDIIVDILVGKTPAKEKKRIKNTLCDGGIQILIGTHALLQEDVYFKELAYIIIDEQHKFGVEQRRTLVNKASHPDILLMTATPIPRSLTLTAFGDMDISKLTVKPSNRLPIVTTKCSTLKVKEVIVSLAKKINQGEQIFWVCPLIEDNNDNKESPEWRDVLTRYQVLQEYYPNNVGILHGKMPSDTKNNIMQDFKDKKFSILVATSVIEVGIDIPNATLIVIENAERFGLAQLHQLRGRVGRSSLSSHCILIYNPTRLSEEGNKRLDIMRASNDGFYIAEQDMYLRGSGELLGEKQSGMAEFFFADLTKDLVILEEANKLALTDTNYNHNEEELALLYKLFNKANSSLNIVIG
jgi:ATP-dependent DNA helicase RecG